MKQVIVTQEQAMYAQERLRILDERNEPAKRERARHALTLARYALTSPLATSAENQEQKRGAKAAKRAKATARHLAQG
jgi:hypothetical protein